MIFHLGFVPAREAMVCDLSQQRSQSTSPSFSVQICEHNEAATTSVVLSASLPSKFCNLRFFSLLVSFYQVSALHNLGLIRFYLLGYSFMGLMFIVIFSYLGIVFEYVMLFFNLGLNLITVCFKIGDNFFREIQELRRFYRRVCCLPADESDHLWSFSIFLSMFPFGGKSPKSATRTTSTILAAETESETTTALTHEMKTKTDTIRLRSSSTIVTIASMPRQPVSFRFRYLKTDSDYHRYLRHLGYCCFFRHFGYYLVTVTSSWVTATLITLGNLNIKNSSSCLLHVLMNIGLDFIQSLLCALIHIGFVCKTNLALDVWPSPLRERRRYSETVVSYEGMNLIGKNWWSYYNLYELFMVLKNLCKVSDFLNRLYQCIF